MGDINWDTNIVTIERQTYPGSGGLVTKQTKGRAARPVPILNALKPVLERPTAEREPGEGLLRGPRGGFLTTARVSDATKWDDLVTGLELPALTRHGLRHTSATWMADAGIPLHVLQRILEHKSIETTRGYLHPDTRHLASAAAQANAFLDAQEQQPVSALLGAHGGADRRHASQDPRWCPGGVPTPGNAPQRRRRDVT
ncbi:tyrosine-type recombinase/integrase [uncultured Microbacterium sp.]|uniref:tyrosine-type recombinase/integrase n=1 Tax=uncultured Microbacterium sp. TaxID=191216 RepID=UPI0025D58946|nr:tyrosine-type recombinase/integrase [uncultured Microbacterium sp.]